MKALTDLKVLAKNALDPIEKKLSGIYTSNGIGHPREISTNNLVQMVIQEATDPANLVRRVDLTEIRRTLTSRIVGENVPWLGAASIRCKDGRLQSPMPTVRISSYGKTGEASSAFLTVLVAQSTNKCYTPVTLAWSNYLGKTHERNVNLREET